MNRHFLVVLPMVAALSSASAKVGDAPEAYAARYGAPIKETLDSEGSGMRLYRVPKFKELRVRFVRGRSETEAYKSDGNLPIPESVTEAIRADNPGDKVSDRGDEVLVRASKEPSSDGDLEPPPNGRETTYTGTVKLRKDGEERYAVLTDHGIVIELPLLRHPYPEEFRLTPGRTYSVTLLEEWSQDTGTKVGVVSRREHVDWFDCVEDAGLNGLQKLIRITDGETVVFDRSICGLHHGKMELRKVTLTYGMYAAQSGAENYCINHFPYFRDFALGGCVETDQSPKSTSIYICPKCVAECNEYTRQHPAQQEKN